MVNNELKFAKILEDVKYKAKSQGNVISSEDVKSYFEDMELSDEQLNLVYEYLAQNKIGVDKDVDLDSYLSEEERDLVAEYQKELELLTPLTEGELRAYSMSAMAGDESAKLALINNFLPQVIELAKLYAGQGVFLEDLIGEGNLALAEGVNMLDALEEPKEVPGMLVKLAMDAMEELIAENLNDSKTDEKILKKVNEVAQKAHALKEELGRNVTVEELIEETGFSEKKIIEAIKLSGNMIEDIEYINEADR